MKKPVLFAVSVMAVFSVIALSNPAAPAEDAKEGKSPVDNLPSYITRLTHFGERGDWSHDGKKILFLEKTFGDVYEVDIATQEIRLLTGHYFHEGYVRALYLANGDILLSGDPTFNADDPWISRRSEAELWVLGKDLDKPPLRLDEKCSEGPAVSRTNMKIAWTIDHGDYPDRLPEGADQIWMADIVYEGGVPKLVNKKLVLDNRNLDFEAGLECQNFVPPDEKKLTFSAYGYQGTEVMTLDLETGEVVNHSKSPHYEEPEGIFPDGQHTLVEADRHHPEGSQYVDVYKLRLNGSGDIERIVHFGDYPGYKSSNPVVRDDGRFIEFQMAKVGDPAGVGRGIFIYDVEKAESAKEK
ncbi:MAG: hypothetical protein ACRD1R_12920 [Acidobacteriota bacterium]